jgi:hypothetical protein
MSMSLSKNVHANSHLLKVACWNRPGKITSVTWTLTWTLTLTWALTWTCPWKLSIEINMAKFTHEHDHDQGHRHRHGHRHGHTCNPWLLFVHDFHICVRVCVHLCVMFMIMLMCWFCRAGLNWQNLCSWFSKLPLVRLWHLPCFIS